jgi:hypothetical protein
MSRNVVKKMTYSATPYLNIIDGPLYATHASSYLFFHPPNYSVRARHTHHPYFSSNSEPTRLSSIHPLLSSIVVGRGRRFLSVSYSGVLFVRYHPLFSSKWVVVSHLSLQASADLFQCKGLFVLSRSVSQSSTRFRPLRIRSWISFLLVLAVTEALCRASDHR